MAVTSRFVLVEYGTIATSGLPEDASNRWPVEEVGVLDLTGEEVADMNRRLLLTPCRVLPAKWFPAMLG